MVPPSLPPSFKPICESLHYSIDMWMTTKHKLKVARKSVCDGYIVTRSYSPELAVFHTNIVIGQLRVKLELYTDSLRQPEKNKLIILRFGHIAYADPVVEYFDFPRYTKRKTIKKWVKDRLAVLLASLANQLR